jgi:FlaA1/EpsC-like NDP-sugar epimerase
MPRVFVDPLRERVGRYGLMLGLDAVLAATSLHAAMALRFDGVLPDLWEAEMRRAVALVVVVRLVANLAARLHAWSFRGAGLPDAVRIAIAATTGSVLLVAVAPWVLAMPLPRTVYALEFFMSSSAFAVVRFGPRVAMRWWGERARRRSGAAPTLVVGVNFAAELLARDVVRSTQRQYDLVGFVGADPAEIGRRLEGKPILGVVKDLAVLIQRHQIRVVLLAIPRPAAASLRKIIAVCASLRVQFKILPAFSSLAEPVSAAMLDDVAPEDLLPRPPVEFDRAELQRLIAGRRALVTGAGGSIGGEICRQLVHYGVRQLVMVDMNENELYLRARRIAEEAPEVDVRAEVADVREPERIGWLGARYRPEYVFHAAAHKHVPLMEDAPGEAVKNNVFGTQHVARMADACGAKRFVLISTDKAVNPSSVMGASKRAAELVVRDLARTSRTRMSAVRFGNVLGSAGSVVPLFKEQIARGGPVTVTHPECTRYFMTIPEAVGLVLVAGLGEYGELCVLDMGEPIRIDELARLMIALSGHVAGGDVRIVYTGLRPGEKLAEELLTEEEEQTRAVRDRIRIAKPPPPPADLAERLEELRGLADANDPARLVAALQGLVPSYRPQRAPVPEPVAAAVAARAIAADPRARPAAEGAAPAREPAVVPAAASAPAPA